MRKTDRFGVIQEFLKDDTSSTGFTLTLLVDGKLVRYECTEEVYNMQFKPEYIFPLITETPHLVLLKDDSDIAVGVEKFAPGVNIYGTYAFGEPKTSGYIVNVRNRKLVMNAVHIKQELDNRCMRYYGNYWHGNMKPVGDTDMELELAEDVSIYCLDFRAGERKHSVKDLAFLTDVLNNQKHSHWISIYDMYPEKREINCICLFMHAPKDPDDHNGGDMSRVTQSREERFAEATRQV